MVRVAGRWFSRLSVLLGLVLAAVVVTGLGRASGTAPDGPGALSHFDLARKDCLGTAENTTSKVWYTVAGGVLSDVYYPTIDNTNVETLQYIVTDGASFTDLQARDMTYTTRSGDADDGAVPARRRPHSDAGPSRGDYE